MKKQLNVMLLLLLVLLLTGCFWKSTDDDIQDAKGEILNQNPNTGNVIDENIPKYEDIASTGSVNTNTGNTSTATNNNQSSVNTEKYTVRYLGDNNFIEIDNLDKEDFANRKVKITGKTLTNVDKILVSFSNSSSSLPDSVKYQLKQFNPGDKTFLYNAFYQYDSLDYGTNEYVIEAYSGNDVAKVEVIIDIPKKETTTSSTEKTNDTQTNINSSQNVSNVDASGINGLILTKVEPDLSLGTSDELNSFLIENTNYYFYWNSLRPIKNNVGVSFYILRIDGENYVYEKHYYTPDGSYGVFELETGTGIDKENIAEKNADFKDKNADFNTNEADEYFKGLLNQ